KSTTDCFTSQDRQYQQRISTNDEAETMTPTQTTALVMMTTPIPNEESGNDDTSDDNKLNLLL
ncbi:9310_t:CDS:2, partial [Dentiscutata heterogama]